MSTIDALVRRLTDHTGIDFARKPQRHLVRRCVERRMAALDQRDMSKYLAWINDPSHPEFVWLVNALTVGHTWFYRDGPQMELIAQLLADLPRAGRPLQIWVAGCATGEDPYTIAMIAHFIGREVSILATDINRGFLERAKAARYGAWSLRELPRDLSWYLQDCPDGQSEIVPLIRRLVRFEESNLVGPAQRPALGLGWDLILCRNVLIYFGLDQARATTLKLARALAPDGRLLLGASELVHSLPDDLRLEEAKGRVMLRRVQGGRPRTPPPAPSSLATPMPLPPSMSLTPEGPALPPPPPPALLAVVAKAGVGSLTADIHMGAEQLVQGELDSAIARYVRILESDTLRVEPRLLLGIAYHLRGDSSEAINALRSALFLEPTLWPAAFYLALTYDRLGKSGEAQREYRRVLETSERHRPLRGSVAHEDLERWKHEVVEIARRRAGQARDGREKRG